MDIKSDDRSLAATFRRHLPDLSQPRFVNAKTQSPYEYSEVFQKRHVPPWLYELTKVWEQLLVEPYHGVTNDGTIRPGLYSDEDLDSPIDAICVAAQNALGALSADQRERVQYPINAREWRGWSNPEFLLRPFGLRLEELPEDAALAILGILEATFPKEGYQKALAAMRLNHFLGELCELPRIMNKYSYNFLLFGEPSVEQPWGWSLYGHHLCLSVFLKKGNVIVAPTFTGAEPNLIDAGPWTGTEILHREGNLGLKLMQSLPETSRKQAQTFRLLHDPGMLQSGNLKLDRWNQDDQRHLCGAFRDNRVVPYEGTVVSLMTSEQQNLILEIAEEFLLYHQPSVRQRRKELISKHFSETYFSWIGEFGDNDPFYFRIQSPVIIFEFDHHSGVFLTNQEPMKFHTHTIVRMPNAGDYGQALREPEEKVP